MLSILQYIAQSLWDERSWHNAVSSQLSLNSLPLSANFKRCCRSGRHEGTHCACRRLHSPYRCISLMHKCISMGQAKPYQHKVVQCPQSAAWKQSLQGLKMEHINYLSMIDNGSPHTLSLRTLWSALAMLATPWASTLSEVMSSRYLRHWKSQISSCPVHSKVSMRQQVNRQHL